MWYIVNGSLKLKRKVDNGIDRYKARTIAKDFRQWYGINYEDMFSQLLGQLLWDLCCL